MKDAVLKESSAVLTEEMIERIADPIEENVPMKGLFQKEMEDDLQEMIETIVDPIEENVPMKGLFQKEIEDDLQMTEDHPILDLIEVAPTKVENATDEVVLKIDRVTAQEGPSLSIERMIEEDLLKVKAKRKTQEELA